MIVLGIESSCDETAASLVQDGQKILSNVVSSQQALHRKYKGVFPEVACRQHVESIIPVIEIALKEADISREEIDLIAVAKGPGLIGALLIGLNVAKALSWSWDIPFVGVNHIEAHLYAALLDHNEVVFPAVGVIISGGHTQLLKIDTLGSYTLLGTTVDDAIGEAFDKVASLLHLPYPGGPAIEELARKGNPDAYLFRSGQIKERPLDLSFSGLKTRVLQTVKEESHLTEKKKADIAASFQKAACLGVVQRVVLACAMTQAKTILLGGGVSSNEYLRDLLYQSLPQANLYFPRKELCVDNAAMIAALGFHVYQRNKQGDSLEVEPMARLPLGVFPQRG